MYLLIVFHPKTDGVIHDVELFASAEEAIEAVERVASQKQLANEAVLWDLPRHVALSRWPKGYPKRERRDY